MAKSMCPFEMLAYGRRLRTARRRAGLSQREAGEVIGCTQSFMSKVEAGEMLLRPTDYPLVADALSLPVLDLIGPLTADERAAVDARKEALAEMRRREGYRLTEPPEPLFSLRPGPAVQKRDDPRVHDNIRSANGPFEG